MNKFYEYRGIEMIKSGIAAGLLLAALSFGFSGAAEARGFLGIGDGKPGALGLFDGKDGTWGVGDHRQGAFGVADGRRGTWGINDGREGALSVGENERRTSYRHSHPRRLTAAQRRARARSRARAERASR